MLSTTKGVKMKKTLKIQFGICALAFSATLLNGGYAYSQSGLIYTLTNTSSGAKDSDHKDLPSCLKAKDAKPFPSAWACWPKNN